MKRESVDVVVVGAGAAGLAAAEALAREGIEVAVLEARTRIGGRILTSPGLPPLERGAEFLPAGGRAAAMLRAQGGVFAPVPDRHVRFQDGEAVDVDFQGAMGAITRAIAVGREGEDRTFAEALRAARERSGSAERPGAADGSDPVTSADAALARRYVEQYHAASADQVSARWVADIEDTEEGGGGGEQLQSLDGLDRLPHRLAAALPEGAVRLGTSVSAVRMSGGGVVVEAQGRGGDGIRLEARRAIVTVPVSLLASGTPRLEGIEATAADAIARLRQGPVVKLGLRFQRPFWGDRLKRPDTAGGGTTKFIHADPPFPTWWTAADLEAPMLVAWAGAGAAERLGGHDLDALLDAALGQLASLFFVPRPEIRRLVEEVAFHDWCADPCARGAYTYAAPGGADAAARLARLPGPILLAGEAVSEAMGTVDGALASGLRAARQVLPAFG